MGDVPDAPNSETPLGPSDMPVPIRAYFTHYDPATGRIVQAGFCQSFDLPLQVIEGLSRINQPCTDPDRQFVDMNGETPMVADRPVLPTFDKLVVVAGSEDAAAITGLPVPCSVSIDGVEYEIINGTLELAFDYVGDYEIAFNHFPYLPYTVTIKAIAQ